MIKIETLGVYGMNHAFRALRNPYDSWAKSDSRFSQDDILIGEADAKLANSLIQAGSEHATFLRMIVCYANITAPRFWWIEADRYRIGKEQISCSTMHTIMRHSFSDADFGDAVIPGGVIADLNALRSSYLELTDPEAKKRIWRRLIETLPQSYMQKRTVMMSYQALRTMCHQRKGHKLSEWHDFIRWAGTLPESWMLLEEDGE